MQKHMQHMSLDAVIDVETLPFSGPLSRVIVCSAEECAMLTSRFGFADLASLTATMKIKRAGPAHWDVTGNLKAEVTQVCGVTGDPVPESVDFQIEERYGLAHDEGVDVEVSLDGAEPLVDGAIDLGEIVAQSLAIAVDPWPRSAGAPQNFQLGDGEKEHPFAGLAALKSNE